MKKKFRVKHIEGLGWFAQAKGDGAFFINWFTIGQHNVGFGLYPSDSNDHPLGNRGKAEALIEDYKQSLIPKKTEYFGVD